MLRQRYQIATFICLLLVMVLPAAQSAPARALSSGQYAGAAGRASAVPCESFKTIFVDGSGGSDAGDGSSASSPFRTLERALACAQAPTDDPIRIIVCGDTNVTNDLTISGNPITISGLEAASFLFSGTLTIGAEVVFENIGLDFQNSRSKSIRINSTRVSFASGTETKGAPSVVYSGAGGNSQGPIIASGSFSNVEDAGGHGRLKLSGGTVGQISGWDHVSIAPEPQKEILVEREISNVDTLEVEPGCDTFTVNGSIQVNSLMCRKSSATINLLSGEKMN